MTLREATTMPTKAKVFTDPALQKPSVFSDASPFPKHVVKALTGHKNERSRTVQEKRSIRSNVTNFEKVNTVHKRKTIFSKKKH